MNILWDLDGTIINTIPSLVETFVLLAKEKGIDADRVTVEKYAKISSKKLFKHFKINWQENLERHRTINRKFKSDSLVPFEGVEEVLKKNKNFLVTNRNRNSAIKLLKYWDLEKYFDEIICVDDGYPRKPAIKSYKYLHKKHKIDLVIGDRALDIIPARKLKIKTCLYQNQKIKSDFHIESYLDFFKMIEENE